MKIPGTPNHHYRVSNGHYLIERHERSGVSVICQFGGTRAEARAFAKEEQSKFRASGGTGVVVERWFGWC